MIDNCVCIVRRGVRVKDTNRNCMIVPIIIVQYTIPSMLLQSCMCLCRFKCYHPPSPFLFYVIIIIPSSVGSFKVLGTSY